MATHSLPRQRTCRFCHEAKHFPATACLTKVQRAGLSFAYVTIFLIVVAVLLGVAIAVK